MKVIITSIFLLLALPFLSSAQYNKGTDDQLSMSLIKANATAIGISLDAAVDLLITSSYVDDQSGIRYVYAQQSIHGVAIDKKILILTFKGQKLLSKTGAFDISAQKLANSNTGTPALSASSAVTYGLKDCKVASTSSPLILSTSANGKVVEFTKMNTQENIKATLIWNENQLIADGKLISTTYSLAWQVYIVPTTSSDYWLVNIDAKTGVVLDKTNLTVYDNFGTSHAEADHHGGSESKTNIYSEEITKEFFPLQLTSQQLKLSAPQKSALIANASYRVVPFPAESPHAPGGSYAIRTNPWLNAPGNATSLNWHTGAGGVDYDYTRGNNTWAYEDRTAPANTGSVAKSTPSTTPSPTYTFNYVPDTTIDPIQRTPVQNQQFNTTNVFYWTNIVHDVMYQYGFTEAAGNFQDDNQGRGGAGNDHVNAEAQDASGTNNANFSTPADGGSGRMQMFLWDINGSSPRKDGDADNGVVVHEFGHGISNRLTGGPGAANCLGNAESMGEGWSDFFALMFTQNWATATLTSGNAARGIGLYALNRGNLFGTSAPQTGIRHFPYSANFAINSQVYQAVLPTVVHDRGEIWAATLWDMTWEIINTVGTIDPNLYNASGTAGNVVALKLVTEGLKLQPCSPGFIDGRDAIIQADINLYGGIHLCAIRKAFARRGMGKFASQGSNTSSSDQTVDFTYATPTTTFTQNGVAGIPEGQNIIYTHTLVGDACGAISNYTLRDTLPLNVTFVSAPGGVYNNATRVVSWPVNLAAGATAVYTLTVNINAGSYFPPVVLIDEQVPTTTISPFWTTASTVPANVWIAHNVRSHSAPNSFFTPNTNLLSDQTLTTTNSIALGATPPMLSFWHQYTTESNFDGCVLEISTNGGTTFTDIGQANITQNGYNGTISTAFSNPIGGRMAWTGSSAGFVESKVNLQPFANNANVKLRWRLGSDASVGSTGWNVDDINIKLVAVVNMRTSLFNDLDVRQLFLDTVTVILPPAIGGCVINPIVTTSADAGAGSLRQAIIDACDGSTITFNMATVTSPITITTGNMVFGKNLTIRGPGAAALTISGGGTNRIFNPTGVFNVNINNLTLTGGNGVGPVNTGRGGAVANNGSTLILDSMVITGNTAANGGAINTFTNGITNIRNSTVSNNQALTSSGGALQNFGGSFTNIINCTFSGNTSNSSTGGGALQLNGTSTIVNSTFTGNTSASNGDGGAITFNGTSLTITNCTITNNTAQDAGGGISRTGTNPFTIKNTIIAGNSATGNGPDVNGLIVSAGFNFVGKIEGSTGFTQPTDITGTTATPANPLLGALANNGGLTSTFLPQTGSPVIDKGGAAITNDQRSLLRPVDFPAITNAAGGDGSDIGAVEVQNAVMVTATATPASQTKCSATAITTIVLTSTVPGTTYAWVRDNVATVTGIPAAGTGNISGTLTNTTTAPLTVTFTITPSGGTPITATVTVNPAGNVTQPVNQTVCAGASTTAVTFATTNTGGTTTYSWTNSNAAIGLAASGTGNIAAFTAVNASGAPITATITVTPTFTNGTVGCAGAVKTFTITVNPTPTVNAVSNQSVCAGTLTAAIAFSGNAAGATYNWTNSNAAIGLAATGTGNIPAFTATNATAAPIVATITVTPVFGTLPNTCSGTPVTFTITVNPPPAVTCPGNLTATSTIGLCTAPVTYTATATGTPAPTVTYAFTGATTGSGAGTGTGSLFNVGVTTVTITAVNTCGTRTCSFTITVADAQPPTITTQPVGKNACEQTTATFTVVAPNAVSLQWERFDGTTWVPVAGATSATLTINNVTYSMNTNTFRVRVTGVCSSVISSNATLTVNLKPEISIVSSQTLLVPGSGFTLTAVTNGAGSSFVWYKNGVIVPGVTGNTLAGGGIDDRATYKVIVTNAQGCVNTSANFTVGSLQTTNIFVYPNPNQGQFQVRFYNAPNEEATVYIYNSGGQVVYSRRLPTGTLPYSQMNVNINNMASGVYVVKLISATGTELGNTKIVVRR